MNDSHSKTDINDGDQLVDISELFLRARRGLPQITGLGLLALAFAVAAFVFTSPFFAKSTTARVAFSFTGFERGQYPDKSKFQPDDLRSPEVVATALEHEKLDTSQEFQSNVRGALTIEGIIPSNVIRERDRLRALGQTLPIYIPDEYLVTLSLPKSYRLSDAQRNQLLSAIIGAYKSKFQRTYANVPPGFGNVFETLRGADYYEYELILTAEIQNIIAYLENQDEIAKTFRSQSTNLSFGDLLRQTQLFAEIQLDETLGLIRVNGVSNDRKTALVKMDYRLRTLADQENKALEDEKVINDLLEKAQAHAQGYVLGVKSQTVQQRPETPIIDQGLIDSLLANDSNNFLVRQALSAGLNLKKIQAEKAILVERRKSLLDFVAGPDKSEDILSKVQKSLVQLKNAYDELIGRLRATNADFEGQRYADAVIETMPAKTQSVYRGVAVAAAVGLAVGMLAGLGLSLMGVIIGRKNP